MVSSLFVHGNEVMEVMRLHWVLRVHLSESVCLKFGTISFMNSGIDGSYMIL